MKKARHLLKEKSIQQIYSVTPQQTVYQALQLMADKNLGAVLVMEGHHLVGIFSERDYARKVILLGKASASTPISEVMTAKLMVIHPDTDVDHALTLMTEKRIRHLPVLDGDNVVGILSIGDLVREKMADQEFTISELSHYIYG
ncbi:CBS domain-containing protein [Chitinibacteraceae bacterium HSL-7]